MALNHDPEGIEVVQGPYFADLEVSTKVQIAYGLEAVRGYDGIEVTSNVPGGIETQKSNRECKLQRRTLWLIVAAVVLLVVVGAVLGGVLGSRNNHKALATPNGTANSSSTTSPSSTASHPSTTSRSSTANPSSSSISSSPIYVGSSIGVTGWWTGTSDFSIRLVYQGDDGNLRLMQYNSGDDGWSTTTTLTNLDVKLGSPIAISCFNSTMFFDRPVISGSNYTQIEIFYVNSAGFIQEWWFREQEIPAQTWNGNGSMSPNGWKAGKSSRFTSYWPSVILQDDSSQVQEILYYNGSWIQNDLGLACQNHSAFAEVPYSISGGMEGGEVLIYQRDDQKLLIEERKQSTTALSTVNTPAIAMPPDTAIGAFSVPRTSNLTDNAMNSYILWQNSTGALQMTWVDDNTGWRTSSTPDSLGIPDSGSDIACLTPTIWSIVTLQPEYGMARCYYLVDRQIREVRYDGSNWSVVGNVQLG